MKEKREKEGEVDTSPERGGQRVKISVEQRKKRKARRDCKRGKRTK